VAVAQVVARISLPIALILGVALATAAPVAAGETASQFDRIEASATSKIGAPWVHYAKGPDKFDCVGFVWWAYNEHGLKDKIGGYRGVAGYFKWFKSRGLVSKTKAHKGDLIVWGRNQHIGIYLGSGMAISALVKPYGVKVHKVKGWLNIPFKAYLHVKITR